MVKHGNRSEREREVGRHSEPTVGDAAAPMAPEDIQRARRRFVSWLRWYMAGHEEDVPTEAALARKLRVSKAAVHYLFQKDSVRSPSFETLLAAKELVGFPIDVMLFQDPPVAPTRRTQK
jgi:hypothetical protein